MSSDDKNAPGVPTSEQAGDASTAPKLDAAVQASLGDMLRIYYDKLAEEPLPEAIVELIEALERGDGLERPTSAGHPAEPRSGRSG